MIFAVLKSTKGGRLLLLAGVVGWVHGAEPPLELDPVTVHSERVANQEPTDTFAAPISGLVFEPQVDVQSRNFSEAQADVSIRGGLFENTGFKVGALTIGDPQTGHYLAELPVAPRMLASPRIFTGVENAAAGFNAGVGTVAYQWQPIRTSGELAIAGGEHHTNRQEIYQGVARPIPGKGVVGVDFSFARSESDGTIPFGDHNFERLAGRLQWRAGNAQSDLFVGRQRKFFGWPNLYTPFGFNESERLETELVALNHRVATADGDYWEAGAFYRRNFDDYEFNRAVPGASNPFVHTSHSRGASFGLRKSVADWAVLANAQWVSDNLQSTSLTFGRFHSREYVKLAVTPEYRRAVGNGRLVLRGGLSFDDTNRDDGALSPLAELIFTSSRGAEVYLQYAESTQVPTYTALNSSASSGLFRGNPDLGRESSRNLELGARWTRGAWTVKPALFRRWDDDLVDWTFRPGVTARSADAVDVATNGFEIVAWRRSAHLDLVLGWTWMGKQADYRDPAVRASFYALNFARQRLTAAVIWRMGSGWELRMDNEYRQQEKNALRVRGGNEAFLSGAGLYFQPTRWRGLELSVRVDNLWDSDFQEVPAVPAGRRQTVFGAAYRW